MEPAAGRSLYLHRSLSVSIRPFVSIVEVLLLSLGGTPTFEMTTWVTLAICVVSPINRHFIPSLSYGYGVRTHHTYVPLIT